MFPTINGLSKSRELTPKEEELLKEIKRRNISIEIRDFGFIGFKPSLNNSDIYVGRLQGEIVITEPRIIYKEQK